MTEHVDAEKTKSDGSKKMVAPNSVWELTDEECLAEIEDEWLKTDDHVRWLINRVHALLANQTHLTDTIAVLIERLHIVTAERDALIVDRNVSWGQP